MQELQSHSNIFGFQHQTQEQQNKKSEIHYPFSSEFARPHIVSVVVLQRPWQFSLKKKLNNVSSSWNISIGEKQRKSLSWHLHLRWVDNSFVILKFYLNLRQKTWHFIIIRLLAVSFWSGWQASDFPHVAWTGNLQLSEALRECTRSCIRAERSCEVWFCSKWAHLGLGDCCSKKHGLEGRWCLFLVLRMSTVILDKQIMPLGCLLCPPLHQLKERVEHIESCWFAWLHTGHILIEVKVGF